MAAPVLIIPGLGGFGPGHRQSLWQARMASAARVEQADWDRPDRLGWNAALDSAIAVAFTAAWGAELADAGKAGHINTASGHGE